jgi:hypothetical protein
MESVLNEISAANLARLSSGKKALPAAEMNAAKALGDGTLERTQALILAAQEAAP